MNIFFYLILFFIFGAENCSEWGEGYYRNYTCNGYNLSVYAATDGYLDTGPLGEESICYIYVGGSGACNS